MPPYTLRPTWPDKPDDYVIRYDGHDVGRCYRGTFAGHASWQWTIYITKGQLEGVPIAGLEDDLEGAKAKFRASFAKMLDAGLIELR